MGPLSVEEETALRCLLRVGREQKDGCATEGRLFIALGSAAEVQPILYTLETRRLIRREVSEGWDGGTAITSWKICDQEKAESLLNGLLFIPDGGPRLRPSALAAGSTAERGSATVTA